MAEGIVTDPAYVTLLALALEQRLPGVQLRHEWIRSNRYRFEVVWDRFDEMEHPERQKLVWDIADAVLSKEDLWKISMILTLGVEDLPGD